MGQLTDDAEHFRRLKLLSSDLFAQADSPSGSTGNSPQQDAFGASVYGMAVSPKPPVAVGE
tara:strand:- start:1483 stop:1665 length:183 start_codon:yes stop_codon:yes gene_type:complete